MTPEERKLEEEQIRSDFSGLQQELSWLQNEISDENKTETFSELTKQLNGLQEQINQISENTDLGILKNELVEIRQDINEFKQSIRWEASDLQKEIRGAVDKQNEKNKTPTTCELLKNSETYNRLLNIISSNPKEFKNLTWDTAEKKLEYIFEKIRNSIILFMKNKLWDSENIDKVIDNTIAPAFEWSLMELLRDQWNETNVGMLQWIDEISRKGNMFLSGFHRLLNWVSDFSKKATWSYNKFSQWVNAVDYLSVHNWVLHNPNKSEVLSNPLEFQKYMNDGRFAAEWFSPYTSISDNIFKIDENQNFEFGISMKDSNNLSSWEKSDEEIILEKIWNIQVVNNPRTTSLIVKMLDKPEQFLEKTQWLQKTANAFLNWVNSLNSVTKTFWVDILWEITKTPEKRSFLYKIMDFVCKLIWITWGLEWIVKKWRLDRMNLTDDKNENISQIFKKYKELAWENVNLNITDENSCKTALNDFAVTDPEKASTTKWDFLRDSIFKSMNISLVSPTVVQQILWDSYLKKETTEKWETKISINEPEKLTDADKLKLAHGHLTIMKSHLEKYKDNDLSEFYTNIHSTEDLALCITASLYVDKDDVIEWVKAKVFLPENYGSVRSDWTVVDNPWNAWRENLDSDESPDKQIVNEQWIYDKAKEYWITDNRQIAYVLSTIKWECWFKNQKEIWWENKDYWRVDSTTWKAYYGRWFIQLTHKYNYEKYTQIIRNSWKDFKDNDWNTLRWNEIDLVNNPDVILNSNDLAAFIAMDWMKNWWPDRVETKKLSYYINDTKTDYYNARIIINWMSSKPQEYANNAQAYADKLWKWSIDNPIESNDLLIWPKLLAHNKDEIGWLGDSIMKWFGQEFQNMDWEVWKNTKNHPAIKDLSDEQIEQKFKQYKSNHPKVKSFMFYFGANNDNNQQTISDITKRSEWLQETWIQPVLTTCIWEDSTKTPRLKDLNQKMIALWKEKNRPVLDFAKSYNKWDIALWTDWLHPTSYSTMTDIINWQLSQA